MMMTPEAVAAKIASGATMRVAGDEALLSQLPRGNWIGGTIPYFMSDDGGLTSADQIYVSEVPADLGKVSLTTYSVAALPSVVADSPESGFTVVILPGMSEAHARYAQDAPDYDGLFMKQIVGWISGCALEDIGKVTPKIFNGKTGEVLSDGAVAMHVELPAGKAATVGIINLFEQGDGDVLTFPADGFSAGDCKINGQAANLADYLAERNIDTRLPLVADYGGERINVCFQGVDAATRTVSFYAPVFEHVEYRLARPVADYVGSFERQLPQGLGARPAFCCNCILNYVYGELEGRQTGHLTGPMTFGEIAYQLVNQTLVYLDVRDMD